MMYELLHLLDRVEKEDGYVDLVERCHNRSLYGHCYPCTLQQCGIDRVCIGVCSEGRTCKDCTVVDWYDFHNLVRSLCGYIGRCAESDSGTRVS